MEIANGLGRQDSDERTEGGEGGVQSPPQSPHQLQAKLSRLQALVSGHQASLLLALNKFSRPDSSRAKRHSNQRPTTGALSDGQTWLVIWEWGHIRQVPCEAKHGRTCCCSLESCSASPLKAKLAASSAPTSSPTSPMYRVLHSGFPPCAVRSTHIVLANLCSHTAS